MFGLAYLAYVGIKYPGAPTPMVFLGLAVFLSVRQYWIAVLPGGTLGGGITHVPSIAVLLVFGLSLICLYTVWRSLREYKSGNPQQANSGRACWLPA